MASEPPNRPDDHGLPSLSGGTLLWFGGSFDPPTRAHFMLAEHARRAIGAASLVYCPAARSPFKDDGPIATGAQRVAMLKAGIEDLGQPASSVSRIEIDRPSGAEPSYTIDTLRTVRRLLPPAVKLRLLIGADQAVSFHRWKDAEEITRIAEPAVLLRTGPGRQADRPALLDAIAPHWPENESDRWRARLIDAPLIDASATRVRRLIAGGAGPDDLTPMLPRRVLSYITANGLYRG